MVAADNPVLAELWRAGSLESQHRGAWVLVSDAGEVLDGRGQPSQPAYARSATKSLQALPFIESGAAEAVHAGDDEIALAISSHSGEPLHVAIASGLLDRLGLDATALQCGPQRPMHPDHLREPARRISNNCSGKHSAFLATAMHLGDDPTDYLAPTSAVQRSIRAAVAAMTGTDPDDLGHAVDGCSAPTFRVALRALATGLARVANPVSLDEGRRVACERITTAAANHPTLVGGSRGRLDTDLLRVSDGRVFAKAGAEGIFAIGLVGGGMGLAVKIDDGNQRGYSHFLIELLRRLGFLDEGELADLAVWRDPVRRNWDGIDVGRHAVPDSALPE